MLAAAVTPVPSREFSFPMNDDETGLPLLRTWRGVYTFVLAAFVLTVALLIALTLAYP